MIDIHSHILPEIDDGAKNSAESIELLREMKRQGITKVVATPHFYIQEQSIDSFLKTRQKSYESLMSKIDASEGLPEIILGAEVYFSPMLKNIDVAPLCIENTDYFILEMPYQNITNDLRRQINNYINGSEKIPILAHIERYERFTSLENIEEMLSYGVLAQINTSSLDTMKGRRVITELINRGFVNVLGSDTHNLTSRKTNFDYAKKFFDRKFGPALMQAFENNANVILNNEDLDHILTMSRI